MVAVNDAHILGETTVNGFLSAHNASFTDLNINGTANLFNCVVKEDVEIRGYLLASSTEFKSKVNVYSNSIKFINSKVSGDLHFLHTTSKKQVVYLDNNSKISGNIIFDNDNGEVILKGNSTVDGKIIGGRVIKN